MLISIPVAILAKQYVSYSYMYVRYIKLIEKMHPYISKGMQQPISIMQRKYILRGGGVQL